MLGNHHVICFHFFLIQTFSVRGFPLPLIFLMMHSHICLPDSCTRKQNRNLVHKPPTFVCKYCHETALMPGVGTRSPTWKERISMSFQYYDETWLSDAKIWKFIDDHWIYLSEKPRK